MELPPDKLGTGPNAFYKIVKISCGDTAGYCYIYESLYLNPAGYPYTGAFLEEQPVTNVYKRSMYES